MNSTNNVRKYDIFLFDADHTLFDYDKAEVTALKTMFERCGFDYSENALYQFREINAQLWQQFEKGEITSYQLQTLRFKFLFDKIGVFYDEEKFNAEYLPELGKGGFLMDGAEEICKYIASHGKLIYIITNGMTITQTLRVSNSLIKDYITDLFISQSIGFQKPHIAYFEYILANIPPVTKEKILIVGDSLTADIAGGNNAGIDTCWFNEVRSENLTDIMPTYEINKLSEVRKFV